MCLRYSSRLFILVYIKNERKQETQFGFRNGSGICNSGPYSALCKPRCVCVFLGLHETINRCQHGKMVELLKEIGLVGKDIRIITNFYWNQKAIVRIENRQTNFIDIKKVVRQDCLLSPFLFTLYLESIFKKAIENTNQGIGENINNIYYSDDTVLLTDSYKGTTLIII